MTNIDSIYSQQNYCIFVIPNEHKRAEFIDATKQLSPEQQSLIKQAMPQGKCEIVFDLDETLIQSNGKYKFENDDAEYDYNNIDELDKIKKLKKQAGLSSVCTGLESIVPHADRFAKYLQNLSINPKQKIIPLTTRITGGNDIPHNLTSSGLAEITNGNYCLINSEERRKPNIESYKDWKVYKQISSILKENGVNFDGHIPYILQQILISSLNEHNQYNLQKKILIAVGCTDEDIEKIHNEDSLILDMSALHSNIPAKNIEPITFDIIKDNNDVEKITYDWQSELIVENIEDQTSDKIINFLIRNGAYFNQYSSTTFDIPAQTPSNKIHINKLFKKEQDSKKSQVIINLGSTPTKSKTIINVTDILERMNKEQDENIIVVGNSIGSDMGLLLKLKSIGMNSSLGILKINSSSSYQVRKSRMENFISKATEKYIPIIITDNWEIATERAIPLISSTINK